MAALNRKARAEAKTHEGAPARIIDAEAQLRRAVMACMLWERQFYESGKGIAERICELVASISSDAPYQIAVDARQEQNLRHVPLLIARELARKLGNHVASLLPEIISRADELTEFLSIYWQDGRCPLSAQVKKGLAAAFVRFDEYQLAKYNRTAKAVTLRDVLFLSHAKPKDAEQAAVWKRLVDGELTTPDTWEVNLSAGQDKRESWERLIQEKKLGGLATLRNLRNMQEASVPRELIKQAIEQGDYRRVLPFRFIAAARFAPSFEPELDSAFLKSLSQSPKLSGTTVVVIDVSGSMYGSTLSGKSDIDRAQAASALGAICREVCEDARIYATAGNDSTRIHATVEVPARRGMALVDAIHGMCKPLGGGGIFLTPVCRFLREREGTVDRMIVITDEQDCAVDKADSPLHANPVGAVNYLITVASDQNGIGYKGKWTHIDGWSDAVVKYICAAEN